MTEYAPRIEVMGSADDVAAHAAALVIATLHDNAAATLGLATGATMAPLYARLVAAYRAGDVWFREATSFNLDEYVGVAADGPGSFHAYMRQHLFAQVDFAPERTHIPDGVAPDIEAEAMRYESLIAAAGGIYLQLLGIGANGHIAFNEPGSAFSSRTREVKLDEATRAANAANFPGRAVPECGITMGIATILDAYRIVLLATGQEKAAAIAAAIEGPLTPECPASALRLHPDVHVICDEAAAHKLSPSTSLRAKRSNPAPQARTGLLRRKGSSQ
jgi:glucosamine-6-phosphate deaminase